MHGDRLTEGDLHTTELQALGVYDWDVHRTFHGNMTYQASTAALPGPRLVAFHPEVLSAVHPAAVADWVDMALLLAKVIG